MGVTGLWQILSPAGRPVTVQSLEGKILAVDISVWLHQALKGTAAHRADVKNAHLVTVFHRLCKLIFHGVRPIIVFDGPNTPVFKQQTLRERKLKRDVATDKVSEVQKKILTNYLKSHAVGASTKGKSPVKLKQNEVESDDYNLPDVDLNNLEDSESEEEWEWDEDVDYSQLDVETLRELPNEIQMELAEQLKEPRKSVTEVDDLPDNLDEFSQFQLNKLLQKNRVTQELRSALTQGNRAKNEGILIALDNAKSTSFTNSLMDRYKGVDVKMEVGRNAADSKSHFVLIKRPVPNVNEMATSSARVFNVQNGQTWPESPTKTAAIGVTEDLLNRSFLSDEESENETEPTCKSPIKDDSEIDSHHVEKFPTSDGTVAPEPKMFKEMSPVNIDLRKSESSSDDDLIDVSMTLPEYLMPKVQPKIDDLDDFPSTSNFKSISPEPQIVVSNMLPLPVISKEAECTEEFVDSYEAEQPDQSIQSESELTEFAEMIQGQSAEAVQNQLESELEDLRKQERSEEAKTKTLTDQIYDDCQSLLKLFGVPYVISPGEAEAQCAWLDRSNISNGSITEDSDVWLFGGKRVYRHVFNRERSGAEFYRLDDFTTLLGLSRTDLILVAMMTGCDYTGGVEGIGVVTAVEILSEFRLKSPLDPPIQTLINFKEWWSSRKGKPLVKDTPIRMRLSKLNLRFPAGFPNERIFAAFLHPEVDASLEAFSWGKPDLGDLRTFASLKLGWPEKKTDEMIGPILKRMNETLGLQTKLTSFTVALQKEETQKASKRLKLAVSKLLQPEPVEPKVQQQKGKRKTKSQQKPTEEEIKPESKPAESSKRKALKKPTLKQRTQSSRLAKSKAKVQLTQQISSSSSDEN